MKSKEALEMIVVDLVPKAKENNKEEIELIEKDLEILEILKDRLYFDYQFNVEDRVYHKIVMKFISFTDDEYEQVKEWLEND